jgi:hypothetical protein
MYYFERYQHALVAYLQTVRTTNAVECRISLLKLLYAVWLLRDCGPILDFRFHIIT